MKNEGIENVKLCGVIDRSDVAFLKMFHPVLTVALVNSVSTASLIDIFLLFLMLSLEIT